MPDRVQKIKQEIERRISQCERLLSTDLLKRERDETLCVLHQYKEILQLIDLLPEEPASEDLEEEITKCYKSRNDLMMTRKQFGELIHHFAEWQHGKDFDDLLQSEMKFPKEFYEKGRFDMREEMMKDAIEVVVTNTSFIPLPKMNIKVGDKVKITIIKEE